MLNTIQVEEVKGITLRDGQTSLAVGLYPLLRMANSHFDHDKRADLETMERFVLQLNKGKVKVPESWQEYPIVILQPLNGGEAVRFPILYHNFLWGIKLIPLEGNIRSRYRIAFFI